MAEEQKIVPPQVGDHAEKEVPMIDPITNQIYKIPKSQVQQAIDDEDYQLASPDQIHHYEREKKYGSGPQQAITALEGAASGAVPLGASTAFETKVLGVDPEDIRGREEVNPGVHGLSSLAGLAASTRIPGLGQANLLSRVGKVASVATKLGKEISLAEHAAEIAGKSSGLVGKELSQFVSKAGSEVTKTASLGSKVVEGAARGAFETALYNGGEEIAKHFKEDPESSATNAAINIGGWGLLGGGVAGSILSAAGHYVGKGAEKAGKFAREKFVSEVDKPALESGDLIQGIVHSNDIKEAEKKNILSHIYEEKKDAALTKQSAAALGVKPLEGLTLGHQTVQGAESLLMHKGAPTVSSVARTNEWAKGVFAPLEQHTSDVLGQPLVGSKADIGTQTAESLENKFREFAVPHEEAYAEIKKDTPHLLISDKLKQNAINGIKDMDEYVLKTSGEQGRLNNIIEDINGAKTAEDLLKISNAVKPNSVLPDEMRFVSKIKSFIKDSVKRETREYADKLAFDPAIAPEMRQRYASLGDKMKSADEAYKSFRSETIDPTLKSLGYKKVYGLEHAIQLITENMTPEKIMGKFLNKNDTKSVQFLAKKFPEEMRLISMYQKNAIREASMDGDKLNFNKVLKAVFDDKKMPPEMRNILFTKEELEKLSHIEQIAKNIPKDINPSGTAHAASLLDYFKSGAAGAVGGGMFGGVSGALMGGIGGIASANARDFAIEQFIKGSAKNAEMSIARQMAEHAIKAEKKLRSGIKSIFSHDTKLPPVFIPLMHQNSDDNKRDKIKKKVDEYSMNPEKMLDLHTAQGIPKEYVQSFGQMAGSAVNYLNKIKPKTDKLGPLDPDVILSKSAEAKYNRSIDLVNNPLLVLDHIKDGTLTPDDMQAVHAVYPKLYDNISQQIMAQISDSLIKKKPIPYKTRITLSMFLTQPLDSSLKPMSIQAAQPKPAGQPEPQQGGGGRPHSMTALNKLPGMNQTPDQARAASRSKS